MPVCHPPRAGPFLISSIKVESMISHSDGKWMRGDGERMHGHDGGEKHDIAKTTAPRADRLNSFGSREQGPGALGSPPRRWPSNLKQNGVSSGLAPPHMI